MFDWLQILPPALLGGALLVGPGLILATIVGLRGLWAWATAPAISMTMYVAASLGLPLLGFGWTVLNACLFSLGFGALVYFLYRFVLRARLDGDVQSPNPTRIATITAWAFGALVITTWIVVGIGTPAGISQTFDNVFHLNAISFIEANGDASPFAIGELTAPGSGGGFYPVAWHGLVALISQTTGTSVAVALNGFNIAIAALIWPSGVLLLVRQIVGNSSRIMLIAGVLLCAFPAFPLNMLFFGVLYPYFLGIALVPVVLAVLLQLLGTTRQSQLGSKAAIAVLLLGLMPGLTLSHPVAMMTVLAMSVPVVLVSVCAGWRTATSSTRLWRILGLAAYGAVGYVMLYKLRPGVKWPPRTSTLDALWRTLSLQIGGYGLPLIVAALTITGIVLALRSKRPAAIAMVGMWSVIAGLHFITAGVSIPLLRGITGVWYGDTPRLEAAMPIVAIPLAVLAADRIVDVMVSRIPQGGQLPAGVIIFAFFFLATQASAGYPALIQKMQKSYSTEDDSILLSSDERTLLERIDQQIDSDEMVVGNPWTGTSLAYAFADRDVLMPHILMQLEGDRAIVMNRLKFADTDPAVCAAVDELNARWFLDFGKREVHGSEHIYAGLDGIEQTSVVELADAEGDAKLYRVSACD
ncbi:DUF6541 family protein [Leucobacter albus]|uniref:DUF6541 family protein n=1 Tax=Leucobacter albus TaxID=272210 RepID=A0ABW3TKY8_9MICO